MKSPFTVIAIFAAISSITLANGQTAQNQVDGTWGIVFYAAQIYSDHIDNPGLYWMRDDGSNKELIVSEKELLKGLTGKTVYETNISPDAKKVAYTTGGDDGILIYDLEAKQITKLADGFSPNWSPDGQDIAFLVFTGSTPNGVLLYEVHIKELRTSDEQTVVKSQDMIIDPQPNTRYFSQLAWSPDGKQIVLSVQLTPGSLRIGEDLTQITESGNTLITVNLDDLEINKLLPNDIQGYRPNWTEKNKIYFPCSMQQNQRPMEICDFNVETYDVNVLNDFRDILPEGEWIVDVNVLANEWVTFTRSYLAPEGKKGDIYSFNLTTETLINLDAEGNAANGSVQWLYRTA